MNTQLDKSFNLNCSENSTIVPIQMYRDKLSWVSPMLVIFVDVKHSTAGGAMHINEGDAGNGYFHST